MRTHRERMLAGDLYLANDPDLAASRQACQRLVDRVNSVGDIEERQQLLRELLGSLGDGAEILPRFLCDYGTQISIGASTFVNDDAILLDCAPIDDHDARRNGWESASPITVGNNVWLGGGVIVCAGVTIVVAGNVVTRDVPDHVLAFGNPCRVVMDIT